MSENPLYTPVHAVFANKQARKDLHWHPTRPTVSKRICFKSQRVTFAGTPLWMIVQGGLCYLDRKSAGSGLDYELLLLHHYSRA